MSRLLQILIVFHLSMASPSAADAPSLVFDVKTGMVVYTENPTALWFPASLTKLMTAYVAFKAIESSHLSLNSNITISARALAEPPSKIGMPVGATIELGKALEILIVKSANDLAVAIAEAVDGSVERFVADMNETAAALGMLDTHFVNPNGLPAPQQVSTARDLALLTSALIRDFPQHDAMFSLAAVKVGKHNLRSHNPLLGKFKGADGMKTGFVCASGYNLIASATRDGRRLVAVVLGAPSGKTRTERAVALLEDAFAGKKSSQIKPHPLAQIARPVQASALAAHMGPVVCKKRYPAGSDPHEVDARLALAAEQRARKTAAKNDTDENGPAGDLPLALAQNAPLTEAVERLNAATPVKGKPAPGIPLPKLRPVR